MRKEFASYGFNDLIMDNQCFGTIHFIMKSNEDMLAIRMNGFNVLSWLDNVLPHAPQFSFIFKQYYFILNSLALRVFLDIKKYMLKSTK